MATLTIRPGDTDRNVLAVLAQLVALTTELRTDFNAVLTKLDADAGVTDTNYSATRAIAAPAPDSIQVVW